MQAGVRRVALLSGGAAVATRVDNPVSQYMLITERAVQDSGLARTILRPYEFMSNALRWAPQIAAGDLVRVAFAHAATAVIDPGGKLVRAVGTRPCRRLPVIDVTLNPVPAAGREPVR